MFSGFSPAAADFLWSLRFNNNKPWFDAHKQEYLELLQTPFRALANEVHTEMNRRFPELNLNLHISRIYRDARRLYGRGPMKDHLWFSLFCAADKNAAVPSFFFSFEPEGCYYGVGCGSANMPKYRAAIRKDPAPLAALAEQFQKQEQFVLEGEMYVRSKGDVGPLLQPWFDRKRLSLCCSRQHDQRSGSPELKQDILAGFSFLRPYCSYWLKIAQQAE